MITYPAVLELTGHVHPALSRAGVTMASQWDAIAVTGEGIFRIDDGCGRERWVPLALGINTTGVMAELGIDADDGRTTIEIRPTGTEVIVRTDGAEVGYVLLDHSDMDMDFGLEAGLADYAEGS